MQNPATSGGPLEERFSPVASEFFLAQPPERQRELADMIASLLQDPSVDGQRVLEVNTASGTWRVLVADDYSVYFRVEPGIVDAGNVGPGILYIDSIVPTSLTVKQSLEEYRAPWEQRPASKGRFFGLGKS